MALRAYYCGILLLGLAGTAASQGLPQLRVDPALLGGVAAPKKEEVKPAPSAASPVAAPEKASTPPSEATVKPIPSTAPEPLAQPEAVKPAVAETVRRAPEPQAVEPAPRRAPEPRVVPPPATRVDPLAATKTAGGASLPALRVDPSLLGPWSAQAVVSAEPPQVAAQPALPPLYSAHAAAGVLNAPGGKKPAPKGARRNPDEPQPTLITADRFDGRVDVDVVAVGAVDMRKGDTTVLADRLTYRQLEDEVEAEGNVRLERDQDVVEGPRMRMQVEENVGFFEQPKYALTRMTNLPGTQQAPGALPTNLFATAPVRVPVTGHGEAERIEFQGEGVYKLTKSTFSTCAPGKRDWYAETSELLLDYNREEAEGKEGKVVFLGVPILYSPWLDFSLNNERASGFLAPTMGHTSKSGLETTLPWYWNIAPNMDATIAPRLMSRRGVQYNGEFRYLDHAYSGQTRVEYMPNDQMVDRSRHGYSIRHMQDFGYGLSGTLNLNGVSDDTYFSDLSTRVAAISQGNLLRQGVLGYSGGWWNATVNAQTYQTLQDPALPPQSVPYKMLPKINLNATRPDLPYGSVLGFNGEYVRFEHPTQLSGRRTTAYPQFSLPLQTSYLQVIPKIGVHVTRYELQNPGLGVDASPTRSVPIASLDTSVVFERQTDMFGRALTQTLEPRLYYLYIPNRDQQNLPVFDTGVADFNFAQIFAENRYGGGDRIADANQLTAALTSRLIDPATGEELLRGLVGQRYYFTTQHVTLPGEMPRTERSADVLAALSGRIMPRTYIDSGWQYNPREGRTERLNIGGRYQPETGKVLNAGYRYTRDLLGQIDVSGQWPIWSGWHAVGRYNYSTKERRMIESVAGLEYDGGCWVARMVVQRIATLTQTATSAIFVQLELNGFSRIGSNPIDILKRNIQGYGHINQPTADPIFGSY